MTVISKAVGSILTIAFCIMFIVSVLKLAKNETGSRTHTETITQVVFPSITICPMEYNTEKVKEISLLSNFTFEDFEALPSIKDNVIVNMMLMKSYYPEFKSIELNNPNSTIPYLNLTTDDIWKDFTFISHTYPFAIRKCSSLQIPQYEPTEVGPSREYITALLIIDNLKFKQLMIEFKANGQSTLNFNPDWERALYYGLPSKVQDFYDFTVQSNKQVTDCDPENKQSTFNCIEKFLASKVDCRFPWLDKRHFGKNNSKICNKSEELKLHLETQFRMYQRTLDNELIEYGCLKRNCLEKSWQPRHMFGSDWLTNEAGEVNPFFGENNMTGKSAVMFTQISSQVHVMEQYELYGFSSFVADVGGFLGLLLGASLLSLFESCFESGKRYFSKKNERERSFK